MQYTIALICVHPQSHTHTHTLLRNSAICYAESSDPLLKSKTTWLRLEDTKSRWQYWMQTDRKHPVTRMNPPPTNVGAFQPRSHTMHCRYGSYFLWQTFLTGGAHKHCQQLRSIAQYLLPFFNGDLNDQSIASTHKEIRYCISALPHLLFAKMHLPISAAGCFQPISGTPCGRTL